MRLIPLVLFVACVSDPIDTTPDIVAAVDTETAVAESAAETETETEVDTEPLVLHGTAPEIALPPPEFSARNYDRSLRNRESLIGAPHVMWFFPFTGTAG